MALDSASIYFLDDVKSGETVLKSILGLFISTSFLGIVMIGSVYAPSVTKLLFTKSLLDRVFFILLYNAEAPSDNLSTNLAGAKNAPVGDNISPTS